MPQIYFSFLPLFLLQSKLISMVLWKEIVTQLENLYNFANKKAMRNIWNYFRNKYILFTAFVLVWMLFFDRHDLFFQWKMNQKIQSMEKDKALYQAEIQKLNHHKDLLLQQEEVLEKYAREQYWMKKENEDVYIIVSEDKPKP